ADADLRAGALGEIAMTRHEVGVEMGLEHPRDAQPVGLRLFEVHLDVARGIDHHGLAGVADQVRGVREASNVELAEVHERSGCEPEGSSYLSNTILRVMMRRSRWPPCSRISSR